MAITITEKRVQDQSSAYNIEDIINIIYPVGSIYISVNNTDPSLLFHGTWERIKDRFLLASGDTYSAGSTGGEAQHTLTVDEMPSHHHSMPIKSDWTDGKANNDYWSYQMNYNSADGEGEWATTNGTGFTGSNMPHNNMPPYLTVYIWKRVA